MVEGMKREARAYIAAGGTAVEYGKRLVERQDAEIYYEMVETPTRIRKLLTAFIPFYRFFVAAQEADLQWKFDLGYALDKRDPMHAVRESKILHRTRHRKNDNMSKTEFE